MNWEQVSGKLNQYKGQMKQKWAKLTDNDLMQIRGQREQLAGILQERYGVEKEKAEKEIDEFLSTLH